MSVYNSFWNLVTHDIGIDLGTANTMVAVKNHGVVISEPSVVAVNKKNGKILAVGSEARRMIGRTPSNIVAVRPLRDGVISDFDSTEAMIRYFIKKVHKEFPRMLSMPRPRVVIGVPSKITEVEGRAVIDAALSAGARRAYIIEEPMAAAIGTRMPIDDAAGSMIIDIGGGTTDIAIISLGGIVVDNTIRIAGDEIDQEIVNYARHKYNILVGDKMAEDIKIAIGSAAPMKKETTAQMKGRDLVTGLPKIIDISSVEIREAITKVLDKIAEAGREALEQSPPEILSDLLERGITLVGGCALLNGIDKYFEEKLKTPVIIGEDPMSAVVKGTNILLSEIDLLERIKITGEEGI